MVIRRTLSVLFTFVFMALAAGAVSAQQIQGEVRYPETNQPVLEAHVECSGTGGMSSQSTGRDGKFFFRVSPGNYNVTVHMPGYRDEQRSVTLTDSSSSEWLPIKLKALPGIGVKNPKPPTVDAAVPAAAQKEFEKGDAALAAGSTKDSLAEAVRHYQQAVTLYPNFVQAQLKLGTAYMDLGDWNKAEETLRKTIATDPKAANAYFALGETYLRQKKNDEAEKVLLEGIQIEDRSYQGHLALARVYFDMALKIKDEAQAKPILEKSYEQVNQSLKLNPDFAQAHLVKGNLLLRVRRAADAQHEFEEYLRLDPKGPLADQTRVVVEKIKKALESEKKP
ncbi:MAG TPA: tetratricopeptide repeat protein [Pyrinomonadaceae bacterium]|jgi:tetratricopeptide (TPR) repeat protein